jgi:hypothetical protein
MLERPPRRSGPCLQSLTTGAGRRPQTRRWPYVSVIAVRRLLFTVGSWRASNDAIFQPAQFAAENPLRELFSAQIRIVSYAVKHPIDAQSRLGAKVIGKRK